jgi:hypothetical protein
MPPPPMPASMDPTTISSTSATIRPVSLTRPSPTRTLPTSSDPNTMSPPPSTSGVSPLASFAQLSLLSPALNSEVSFQAEPPTQDQGKAEMDSQEGLKIDTAEATDASVADMSSSRGDSSTTLVSSVESGSVDSSIEDDASIDPPSVLDSHAPGFSRTLPIYSCRHDEDDEVDYSPHSPEPSLEDANMYSQSRELHPNISESPDAADSISHSVLDNPVEPCNNVEPHAYDQTTTPTASTPPLPVSSPTSLLSTDHTNPTPGPALTNPESEPPLKPSSQELQQSHPPQPKVKLTLKDFALRKKRQREQALSQNIQASPVTPSPSLHPEGEEAFSLVKPQVEISSLRDCLIADYPHQVPSSHNPNDGRRVVNGARDVVEDLIGSGRVFDLDIKSKENSTPRNESENRTNANPNHSPLPPTSSFPKGTNGHSRLPLSHHLPNRPPPTLLLPPRPIQQQLATNSRDMKQEVIEALVPSLLQRVSGFERSVSPINPDPTPIVHRISQEEEGEIGETSMQLPSRGPFGPSSKRDPNNLQQPSSRNVPPFSHSPPIGPRFYLNQPTSPSSLRPTPPSMPPIPSVAPNNTNGNRPNLPTAPRALRQSMLQQQRPGPGPPPAAPYLASLSLPPHNAAPGSALIPRGPSADRDKEREKVEWEQRHYRAPPRRGAGNGRGTPWGR